MPQQHRVAHRTEECGADDEAPERECIATTRDLGGTVAKTGRGQKLRRLSPRTINARLRARVLIRDNCQCRMCGTSPLKDPAVTLQVDHIVPWSKGGRTVPGNLQTLCARCNVGKSNFTQRRKAARSAGPAGNP